MADEDGWVGLTWNHPLKYDDNFALAGFDRTHVVQLGFVYELPFLKDRKRRPGSDPRRLAGERHRLPGTPARRTRIGGTNNALNCQGCGSILINYAGDKPEPVGERRARLHRDLLRQERSSRSRPASTSTASATPSATSSAGRRVERRPVALQGVPGRARPSGDPDRGRERVQPPELGRADHDVHREQLPAVHSRPTPTAAAVPRPARPTRRDRGSSRSACGCSSRRVLIVHARPARAGRA